MSNMSTKILVAYYSAYGHTYKLAQAGRDGAKSVDNTEVKLAKVPELDEAKEALEGQEAYQKARKEQEDVQEADLDDLRWADGICWGSPTRFGNMTSQLKQFIDTTGGLWEKGTLSGKPAGIFTSTATTHGGQETTIISMMLPLLHHGMIIVGTPYAENPQILTADAIGGSPYGPSTIVNTDGSKQPAEEELETARNLGKRVAKVAASLKD